ncbi:P-loop containing nucleoside triphosphate hydrolase protein [Kockovaella imperatae]|uniref:Origin recognition complex subunit 1 n=1 Tax=Kockovaella imperatae TaxID=4999 RepID=A0A1Y1ULU7_9TREE|nr:P-loop containing nucleoside triphosphate hydrolase protein [Kockovaella imperatae]ORX38507.1 P-loop containing nucleoside triphosphate hydrolase protein [Kockovaella imperatae]
MPITPRRSTRGTVFSPLTPSSTENGLASRDDLIFNWTSAPVQRPSTEAGPSSQPIVSDADDEHGLRTYYTSFTRIQKPTGKKKKEEVVKFRVGDGVMVSVEGGDGVAVLTRLWEEPIPKDEGSDDDDDDDDDDEDEEADDEEGSGEGEGEGLGMRKMAEIHWCFRRKDLPGIMKDLKVEENEVFLAASATRAVTTPIPLTLLVKTVPIHTPEVYTKKFAPEDSVVKGWTYVRQGVYWCAKAFDKGAKGGRVFRIDIDAWKEAGRNGQGWQVMGIKDPTPSPSPPRRAPSVTSDDDSGSEAPEGGASASEDERDEGDDTKGGDKTRGGKKRKSSSGRTKVGSGTTKRIRAPAASKRRLPHPKSSTSRLPASVPSAEDLPVNPYERALRLLHVGATPESLPCREEEFVDVLSKVEEGVESGGGGCLYIAGVPGTGKTATVHAVVKELKRKAEDGELPPFSYVEINGLKVPSPQHAYSVLWEAISGAKGTSPKTALRGLEAHFGRKTSGVRGPRGHTFVVLMDELDQLLTAKQDVVYNFFNWPAMRDSQLFVMAVANRMDLPQHLAAKIKSRLGLQTLLFQPYDRTSLIEIVQSRLIPHPRSEEEHKVLQPDAIALAATKMAGTNGDARRVLDACRRAVEVAIEPKADKSPPHPVTAKEMMSVLNLMSSSPVAMFIKQCSEQQKMMMAAVVRCVRREGVPEIPWRSIRSDHDALTRSLMESNDLLSPSELGLIFTSLVASHALTWAFDAYKILDDRKVALGLEIGEVGRVLMNEGEGWRRALAGV